MDIGIFIEYNNRVVQIPVNPSTFNVKTGGNNDTAEIIFLGEIVLPRKKKLSTISWDSFFPYQAWFPAIRTSGEFQSAGFYLEFLNRIRDDCMPCHLTVTGIGFDDDVVIESFDYYHQAGDHEDTYYSISFKRYQPYEVSIISTVDINGKSQPTRKMGKPASDSSITLNASQITIGCEVILNGAVHYDSYGEEPSKTYTNYKARVDLINKKGSHPYHVTSLSGSPLGWATAESISFSGSPSKEVTPAKTSTAASDANASPIQTRASQIFSPLLRKKELSAAAVRQQARMETRAKEELAKADHPGSTKFYDYKYYRGFNGNE